MASKKVAVDGDVTATAGTTPGIEGSAGPPGWTAGKVSYQTYSHLTVGGKEVAYEATCTFSYSGTTTSAPATAVGPKTADVTLKAKSTVLQNGSTKVLVDGDKEEDTYGNKLSVSAGGVLKSA
jgi:hypothetical protein